MTKYIAFLILTISLVSCKSLYINNKAHHITQQNIPLATLGEQKGFSFWQDYNHIAIPDYHKPIKVQVNPIAFKSASFKAFDKAHNVQNKKFNIKYVDSVKTKPMFLNIEIADRVALLHSLNTKKNHDIFQFFKHKKKAHIVTGISILFNKETMNLIKSAEEVFLEQIGVKSYALKTYTNGKEQQTVHFNDAVIFTYHMAYVCWEENSKHQLQIVDLVEKCKKCPSKTYRKSKRAKHKNSFKDF